jgi:hypothetical protein
MSQSLSKTKGGSQRVCNQQVTFPYERFLSLQGVVNPLYYGVNRVYMGFTRENCPCKQFTMAISLPL